MRPIISGSSLAPGDLLVIPLLWVANEGFGPPNMLESSIHPELSVAEQVAKSVWNEPLSGQTVTNFYGGSDPVMMRDHPRLAVGIYQIKEWRTAR